MRLILASLWVASTPVLAQTSVSGARAAQPSFEPDSVVTGAHLSILNVQTLNMVFGYGIFADYALNRNFLVGGTLDYWNQTSAPIDVSRVQISDLALGGNAKLVFTNVKVPFRPYALAGVAMHRFDVSTGEATGERINKLRSVSREVVGKFGIDLGGGFMYRVAENADLAGELRWRSLADTSADLNQLALTGGLSYAM